MRRLDIPGGSYTDARAIDQAFASQLEGQPTLSTHAEMIAAPDDLLFVRIPYVGPFKIAGKQHNGNDALEYDGAWQDRGPAIGNRPIIYDGAGSLVIAETQAGGNPVTGALGYRYADDAGRLVPAVDTYADAARQIYEYTTHGDVTIGQGGAGGCVALADGTRYLLEPGDCQMINVDRQGDQFAVSIAKFLEHKAVILWFARHELSQFAEQTTAQPAPPPSSPPPAPAPAPAPSPEPPAMSVPNLSPLLTSIAAKYNLTDNSVANCAAIVHEFVETARRENPEWGYISKVAGETQYEGRSQDSVAYGQANPISVKLISGAGDPHPVQLVWVEGAGLRSTDHWLYPDSASFAPTPAPPTPPPPAPPAPVPDISVTPNEPDLAAILAAVQANGTKIDHVTAQVNAFVAEVKQYLPAILAVLGSNPGALSSIIGALTAKKSA